MRRIRSITIAGKRWLVDWSKPEGDAWALCHHDEHRIQIDPRADDITVFNCFIDEMCHAHFPALDNDCVDAFSDDVTAAMQRADLIKSEGDE